MTKQFAQQQLEKTRNEYRKMRDRLNQLATFKEKNEGQLKEVAGLEKRLAIWVKWGEFYKSELKKHEV